MATTIKLKNGTGAPLAGDLVQGEPALDLTNKRLYTENASGTVIEVGTNPTSLTTGTFTSTGIDDNATSTAITIDSSENVGIGVTPEAWNTYTPIQVQQSSLSSFTNGDARLTNNAYYSSGWKYIDSRYATQYLMDAGNGIHTWSTATSGTADGAVTWSERMRIDNSGNLGIGTSSPSNTLHVDKDTGSTPTVYINNGGGDSGDGVALKVQASGRGTGIGDASVFSVHNNASEIFTVRNDGNVGIGTASPSTNLDIQGSSEPVQLKLRYTGNTTGLILKDFSGGEAQIVNADNGPLVFKTNNDEKFRVTNTGKVGIGTASPASLIHGMSGDLFLTANSTSADSGQGVYFQSTTNGWSTAAAHATIFGKRVDASNGYLRFDTRGSGVTAERMRIDSVGNIRLTATGASAGDNLTTINFYNTSSSLNLAAITGFRDSGGTNYGGLKFSTTNAGSISERMRIDTNGNVGIGTTSPSGAGSYKILQVRGGSTSNGGLIRLETSDGTSGVARFYAGSGSTVLESNSNTPLVFGTNATERMRIDANGNVLIGKTTVSLTTAGVALLPTGELYVVRDSGPTCYFNREGSDGDVIVIRNDNVNVGSISVSGSTTSYNPSSDVRLKENIRDYDNALADVMKLKPRKYSWKADGAEDSGFIAQELMETPEFANRVNPIDDDADDPMYGVDYMKFVAVLTGAIQEQQAMIEELKAEVAALKGE